MWLNWYSTSFRIWGCRFKSCHGQFFPSTLRLLVSKILYLLNNLESIKRSNIYVYLVLSILRCVNPCCNHRLVTFHIYLSSPLSARNVSIIYVILIYLRHYLKSRNDGHQQETVLFYGIKSDVLLLFRYLRRILVYLSRVYILQFSTETMWLNW